MSLSHIAKIKQAEQIQTLMQGKVVADFGPGDTIAVKLKIVEGVSERVTVFQGVCVRRRNSGITSNFVVRKVTAGVGIERLFPIYSPLVLEVSVVRRGAVRRANLTYLRSIKGNMKIKERFLPKKS